MSLEAKSVVTATSRGPSLPEFSTVTTTGDHSSLLEFTTATTADERVSGGEIFVRPPDYTVTPTATFPRPDVTTTFLDVQRNKTAPLSLNTISHGEMAELSARTKTVENSSPFDFFVKRVLVPAVNSVLPEGERDLNKIINEVEKRVPMEKLTGMMMAALGGIGEKNGVQGEDLNAVQIIAPFAVNLIEFLLLRLDMESEPDTSRDTPWFYFNTTEGMFRTAKEAFTRTAATWTLWNTLLLESTMPLTAPELAAKWASISVLLASPTLDLIEQGLVTILKELKSPKVLLNLIDGVYKLGKAAPLFYALANLAFYPDMMFATPSDTLSSIMALYIILNTAEKWLWAQKKNNNLPDYRPF